MIRRLHNPVRRYAWGSVDAIPALLGVPPDGGPQAELWLGAHERAASRVLAGEERVSLLDLVRADPARELGPSWAAEGRLPFLAKVLATAEPLSLQVHPDAALAARGYADEEARRVDRDLGTRSFPDAVAKVEMVWALSEFRALCGFRPAAETVAWLERLDVAALKPTAETLREHGETALHGEVARLLRLERPAEAVATVRARADVLESDPRWGVSARVAAGLATRYPRDPAVCLALLLRPVVLAAGEAMEVRPGQPHSYLSGTAVEVQANSDNVLRAGLTTKHVDVDLLLRALDTTAPDDGTRATFVPQQRGEEQVFAPDTDRFALAVLHRAEGGAPLPAVSGPQVFLCLDGDFRLQEDHDDLHLGRGQAAYVSAAHDEVRVRGAGTLLRVTTGRREQHS